MKVAVIGSRSLVVSDLERYLPEDTDEIVSGGAYGVDDCAGKYALAHGIKLTVFFPEYEKYGRAAPLKRNLQIISHADEVVAFWDGESSGTRFVIETCRELGKPLRIISLQQGNALCGGEPTYSICQDP